MDVDDAKPVIGAARARVLDRWRSEQRRERAEMSIAERVAVAASMLDLARRLHGGLTARGDEAADLLLRVRASFRERCGG